jgi:hypothetical protein
MAKRMKGQSKSNFEIWNKRNREEEIELAEKHAVYQDNSGTFKGKGKGKWIDMAPYL